MCTILLDQALYIYLKIFLKDLTTDDIIVEYLSYRACDLNIIYTLKNFVKFKLGMMYSNFLSDAFIK